MLIELSKGQTINLENGQYALSQITIGAYSEGQIVRFDRGTVLESTDLDSSKMVQDFLLDCGSTRRNDILS